MQLSVNGFCSQKSALAVNAAQIGHTHIAAPACRLDQNRPGYRRLHLLEVHSVRGINDLTGCFAQHHVGAGYLRQRCHVHLEIAVTNLVALFQVVTGKFRNILGMVGQRLFLFVNDIAIGQQRKGARQQAERQQHHAEQHGDLPLIKRIFQPASPPFTQFPVTSNL